jgi:hypothetical protein
MPDDMATAKVEEPENEGVVHADPNEVGLYELESLCMNCEENVRIQPPTAIHS